MSVPNPEIFEVNGKTYSFDINIIKRDKFTPKQAGDLLNTSANTVRSWTEKFEEFKVLNFERDSNHTLYISPRQFKILYFFSKIREAYDREPLEESIERLYDYFTLPPMAKKSFDIEPMPMANKPQQSPKVNVKSNALLDDSILTFLETREDKMIHAIKEDIQQAKAEFSEDIMHYFNEIVKKNENQYKIFGEEVNAKFDNFMSALIESANNVHFEAKGEMERTYADIKSELKQNQLGMLNLSNKMDEFISIFQNGNENQIETMKALEERVALLEKSLVSKGFVFLEKLFPKRKEYPRKS